MSDESQNTGGLIATLVTVVLAVAGAIGAITRFYLKRLQVNRSDKHQTVIAEVDKFEALFTQQRFYCEQLSSRLDAATKSHDDLCRRYEETQIENLRLLQRVGELEAQVRDLQRINQEHERRNATAADGGDHYG